MNAVKPLPPQQSVPDLTTYREVHQAMRVTNEQVVGALTELLDHDVESSAALGRWFAGYGNELRAHHEIEDHLFFPALAARVPGYAEHSAVLNDDHHRLDELIDGLRQALDRMAKQSSDWTSSRAESVGLATELRDLMAGHLDFEDSNVLPMFERHFSVDEYAALDAQALKQVTVRQALFTVPWWMATAAPEAAARTLAEAPMPLRVVYRLTRRRYAALVRRAFGAAVPGGTIGGRS